jgi:cytidine deaminase
MKPEILISQAIDANKHCHVPYSTFKVGAAILTQDGKIIVKDVKQDS